MLPRNALPGCSDARWDEDSLELGMIGARSRWALSSVL